MATLQADLILIGAGYAGICAFEAASHHLSKGSRVVVVDRNEKWGGMWNHVYDYVRLHQPYKNFTAGARQWSIGSTKPDHYLARKGEILSHFTDISLVSIAEKELDVVFLFSHEIDNAQLQNVRTCIITEKQQADNDKNTSKNKQVQVVAYPVGILSTTSAPRVTVTGDRMINAVGFDILRKLPLSLSASSNRVHSLTPADILTGSFTSLTHFSTPSTAPIWVVGSGKTAMDVIYHIAKKEPSLVSRLRCVSGRGTWFLNREKFFPTGWYEQYVPSMRTSSDLLFDILEKYDGNNAQHVYQEMCASSNAMHSAIPNPSSFVLGISSTEEINVVRQILSPPTDKIVKGYLVDVIDDDDASSSSSSSSSTGVRLLLRDLSGKHFDRSSPQGTIIINATDNLTEENANRFVPVIDSSGLVLSPQRLCGFTGPSATLCVHAWYAGTLSRVWKILPRLCIDIENKSVAGLHLMSCVVLNTAAVMSVIPKTWIQQWIANGNSAVERYPMYRMIGTGLRAKRLFPLLMNKFGIIMKERYTDKEPYNYVVKERSNSDQVLARL